MRLNWIDVPIGAIVRGNDAHDWAVAESNGDQFDVNGRPAHVTVTLVRIKEGRAPFTGQPGGQPHSTVEVINIPPGAVYHPWMNRPQLTAEPGSRHPAQPSATAPVSAPMPVSVHPALTAVREVFPGTEVLSCPRCSADGTSADECVCPQHCGHGRCINFRRGLS